jgi:hypothetical protein
MITFFSVLGGPSYFDTSQNVSTVGENTGTVKKVGLTTTSSNIPTTSETPIHTAGGIPTPTQTPTSRSTITLTHTQASTSTPTHSATPVTSNDPYTEFVATVFGEAEVDADIPVRIRGWSMEKEEVLYVAVNLSARSRDDVRRANEVNVLVTSGFAQAVAHHDTGKIDGSIPKKLRIVEIDNTRMPPKAISVNTSLARDYYTSQLTGPEFTKKYWDTVRNQTNQERRFTKRLDRDAGNVTLFNQSEE